MKSLIEKTKESTALTALTAVVTREELAELFQSGAFTANNDDIHTPIDEILAGNYKATSPLSLSQSIVKFPELKANGKPKPTLANFIYLIEQYGIKVRFNMMSKEMDIYIPGTKWSITNGLNTAKTRVEDLMARNDLHVRSTMEFLAAHADNNMYHPVIDWIQSKEWDGEDRLTKLLDLIKFKADDPFNRTLVTKWLIQCVQALNSPYGYAAQGVLVFQGAQGIGKTTWLKNLVPSDYSSEWVKDGVLLNVSNNDSVMGAIKHWIVELGEIDATFRKSDISQTKAFLTREQDHIRLPYAAAESKFPRQTVFFGSVNPAVFLSDPTGNRRYWTVPVEKLDFLPEEDRQQLWAQIWNMFKVDGATAYLTPEESKALNTANERFAETDPIVDSLQEQYDFECQDKSRFKFVSSKNLRGELLLPETPKEARRLSTVLGGLGIESKKGREGGGGKSVNGYVMPPRINNYC
ncbi:MAG: hypothetical protein HRU04_05665 [Oceanospirillaceae bacterium]|nr:hypothetical protein [Oceanospirillaceae bacterium]